jgi:hypothetical protein
LRHWCREAASRALAYQSWLSEGANIEDIERMRTHLQKERDLEDRTFQVMIEKALGRPAAARPRRRPRRTQRQVRES